MDNMGTMGTIDKMDKKDYIQFVESNKYFKAFDQFMEEHPELNPEWREFVEPRIQKTEKDFFSFLFGLF
jgi:hypothetical protein